MQDSYTFVCEMLVRETILPEVCQEFKKLNFLVQLSGTNPLGRCKSDKLIETTIIKKNLDLLGLALKKALIDVGLERFTKAFVSLHTFTVCVTVRNFADLGKTEIFRIMERNVEYVKIFEKLGEEWLLEVC